MAAKGVSSIVISALKRFTENEGFNRVMKTMQLVSISKGQCVYQLTVDDSHVNPMGTLHGGLIASVIDNVSTAAIMSNDQKPGVSVDMNISYLSPARPGDILEIKSECIKQGQKLAFATVDMSRKSDGRLIAVGRHTKYLL